MYTFYNNKIKKILKTMNYNFDDSFTNEKLDEYLFNKNLISEEVFLNIESELYKIPIKNKNEFTDNIVLYDLFKKDFYEKNRFIIIKNRSKNIVLTRNIHIFKIKNIINTVIDNKYEIYFITNKELNNYIDLLYNKFNEVLDYDFTFEDKAVNEELIKYDELEISNYPIVKIVDEIIDNAINFGASDVHFEPNDENVIIKMRLDGILYEKSRLSLNIYLELLTRIKIMADINITKKYIPQDGKIKKIYNDKIFDLRISTLPTIYGERVSIRILDSDNLNINYEDLGFLENDLFKIDRLINKKNGIVLVCGPTGCGKSTTLYAFIKRLKLKGENIITVEDPVEYSIKGVNQVQVNNQVGLTFANCLRSILRQDPNIIMIGEIRDEETAEMAIRASITGHLVFSTLHTNDSFTAITRLLNMKIPAYLVSEAVTGVISQRLVRRLCDYCKEETEISDAEKEKYFLDPDQVYYKAVGCSFCNDTGYMGRIAAYEIIEIDDEMRKMIVEGKSVDEMRLNTKKYTSLSSSAKSLLYKGVSSLEEVRKLLK